MTRFPLALPTALAAGLGALAPAPARADDCPQCKRKGEAGWRFCPFDGATLAPSQAAVPTTPTAGAGTSIAGQTGPITASPMRAVDDLFDAIAAADEAGIRRCYRWEHFFAGTAPADMEGRVADYTRRLVARVRPTLAGRKRVMSHVNLGADWAEIQITLRDPSTRETAAVYDFKLSRGAEGWRIVSIRP